MADPAPSTRRIAAEAGWEFRKRPTGPTGRPTCRRCGAECLGRRRTFCGDACVHEHRIRSDPGYVRACLLERDHGVCRACGRDCIAWQREVRAAMRAAPARDGYAVLAAAGLSRAHDGRSFWDADHIVEVVEGGGECGLDNYQTLCYPCHRAKTADLARRRSERRAGAAQRP